MVRDPTSGDRVEAIPKIGGGMRWITHLSPDRERLYRRLIDPLVPRIERSLGPGVIANRALDTLSSTPSSAMGRGRWRAALTRSIGPGSFVIVSDVRECYGSIGPAAVRAGLARSNARCPDDVEAFLRTVPQRGLPVGPRPSAILANAVLAIADDATARTGAVILRWVDDVVIAGADRRSALAGFEAWRSALAWLGLVPNEAKTRPVTDGTDACAALLGPAASGASGAARGIIRSP
jgi:hypothetical protein